MQSVSRRRRAAHYVVRGHGAPVVLVHGVAASLRDWDYLAPELATGGFRSYALDLLGHGDSPKPTDPAAYHIEALYADLRTWLDELGLSQSPILLGHSVGGYLALTLALREPGGARALVLISPLFSPSQLSPFVRLLRRRPLWGARALGAAPAWLIEAVVGWEPSEAARFPAPRRRQVAADFRRAAPQIVNIPKSVVDLAPELPAMSLPTLVLWGEKDRTLDPRSFPQLVNLLPNAAGRAVPNCGHQPHLASPGALNRLVLDFLKQL